MNAFVWVWDAGALVPYLVTVNVENFEQSEIKI